MRDFISGALIWLATPNPNIELIWYNLQGGAPCATTHAIISILLWNRVAVLLYIIIMLYFNLKPKQGFPLQTLLGLINLSA